MVAKQRELIQAHISKVLPDNNVRNCIEHKPNVPSIGGAGEVRVDLFLAFLLVQVFKPHSDIVLAVIVCIWTWGE